MEPAPQSIVATILNLPGYCVSQEMLYEAAQTPTLGVPQTAEGPVLLLPRRCIQTREALSA